MRSKQSIDTNSKQQNSYGEELVLSLEEARVGIELLVPIVLHPHDLVLVPLPHPQEVARALDALQRHAALHPAQPRHDPPVLVDREDGGDHPVALQHSNVAEGVVLRLEDGVLVCSRMSDFII